MEQFLEALLILVPFGGVAAISGRMVEFCRKTGMMAEIDQRRAHVEPTPHGGGVAMVVVGVPVALLAVAIWQPPYMMFLIVMLLTSLLVAWVGWLDDKHELSPRWRLVVHLLAVGIGLVMLPPMFDTWPLWLDKLILMLAWGWFVNLYNFMDGADGLAATEAAFLGIAVALLAPAFKPVALVLAGVGLGFLRVNWQPARVFMGDVGATWLGYVLGGLLLVACADDTWRIAWPIATVTLVFCADATWTLLRRIWEGHKPWEPHRTFWFHRFLGLGYSHGQLVTWVVGINLILLLIAVLGYIYDWRVLTLILGVMVVVWVGWRINSLEKLWFGH